MVFVDTESNIEPLSPKVDRHTLWFGSAIFVRIRKEKGKEWKHEEQFYFTTGRDFWGWLEGLAVEKSRTFVYAHNWNYDAGILSLATIPSGNGWECIRYINDRPPFVLTLRRGTSTLIFVDTLNYFSSSLKVLGESIGISKLSYPSSDAPQSRWDAYNIQDTIVIKEAMLAFRSFIEENDLGNWQNTLASQAFQAFRHRFMEHRILIHDNDKVCQLERAAYYGGRSEAFFVGSHQEELFYLDINSMYPSIMASYPVPTMIQESFGEITTEELSKIMETKLVIAEVEVDTPLPIFPVRYGGRLIFPTGTFKGVFATPEIRLGLTKGYIKNVLSGSTYTPAIVFKSYVDTLYTLRRKYEKEGNPVFSYACKILLNSLYGKFGQNGKVWDYVRQSTPDDPMEWIEQESPDVRATKYRVRLGAVQRMHKEGESENSFPAIAGHITSYGRVMLWTLFEQAGRENVLYCDTDSLIVTKEGFNRLQDYIDPSALGALKLETTVKDISIFGPKDYIINGKAKHKGVRATAKQLAWNIWEHDTFRTWDWLLSNGNDGYIQVEHSTKTLHRAIRKGKHLSSGWIQPYSVPDDISI